MQISSQTILKLHKIIWENQYELIHLKIYIDIFPTLSPKRPGNTDNPWNKHPECTDISLYIPFPNTGWDNLLYQKTGSKKWTGQGCSWAILYLEVGAASLDVFSMCKFIIIHATGSLAYMYSQEPMWRGSQWTKVVLFEHQKTKTIKTPPIN